MPSVVSFPSLALSLAPSLLSSWWSLLSSCWASVSILSFSSSFLALAELHVAASREAVCGLWVACGGCRQQMGDRKESALASCLTSPAFAIATRHSLRSDEFVNTGKMVHVSGTIYLQSVCWGLGCLASLLRSVVLRQPIYSRVRASRLATVNVLSIILSYIHWRTVHL